MSFLIFIPLSNSHTTNKFGHYLLLFDFNFLKSLLWESNSYSTKSELTMKTLLTLKNSLLSAVFVIGLTSTNHAQQEHRCVDHQNQYNSVELNHFQTLNKGFKKWKKTNTKSSTSEYEIPVVVHVLYRTASENISTAQIQSQIDVLNEDYNKQSDWQNTVSDFIGIVGDAKITFTLATTDPSGNPTTGINRKQTTKQGFDYTANEAKKTSAGGIDPWNPNQYLNLWCVNDVTYQGIKNAVLGYAQFPGLAAATDGVVIRYEVFGRTGNLIPGYDKGRTATHEVGHWLGLKHLWGLDGQDGCNASDDDDISDTPLQSVSSAGCPTNQVSCGSKDNVQNFMDYSDDACMTMFTLGQVEKMQYTLENIRTNFKVENDLNYDIAASSVSNLGNLNCGNSITPSFTLQNKGLITLQSYTLEVKIDNSTVYNQTQNVTLASNGSVSIALDEFITTTGANKSITIIVSNPNEQTDQDNTNNTVQSNFSLQTGMHLQFSISESSLANTMNWNIQKSNAIVLSKNDVTATSSNNFQSQEFCLEDDECYDFIITDAFSDNSCSAYSEFNLSTQYAAGDQFIFNGTIYEAKQLIWGSSPDLYGHYYNNLGSCPAVNGDDYYKIVNKTTNEEIAKVKVSEYNSPETTNFCLALATQSKSLNATKIVNVYPNPFENQINFSTTVELVKIYDAYGKLIQVSNNTNQIGIPIHLSKGVYYLEIYNQYQVQKEIVLKK